jgi:solute carrier family 27 fatty acid transporter 1/4
MVKYDKTAFLLYGESVAAIAEISEELEEDGIVLYCSGGKGEDLAKAKNLDLALAEAKPKEGWLEAEVAKGKLKDKALYIYTSGTTGLPKAAVMTHAR